ncbi:ABC transporter substrate-binding protein [Pseudogracilibacillus auburnensis]|uniref:Carbohydrate ABC transporter substrate-binding protein (CUT1 family) n=1 Tax=Pseudogracilibacillus auburnensis TaxID=1494959 RepID=A0A2V3VZZ5_9BACI|nr:sugar ABC transporter substrate-binding protein [Pseudogracilibacillus auburnensis]MBO1004668.1 sugar ABC transporter substrate-binding protein [Pseudogracilibacillus auburnensis]PXW85575.1 carbohydrate ABC transporter substrate-binding protein (CUT1 family) [Pseudogracilibacillus auburnensis]
MKRIWMLLITLVVIGVLGACSEKQSKDGTSTEGTSSDSGDLTGEIVFNTMELSPTFDDYINGMIEAFEEEYPGAKVKWEDVPAKEIERKTLTEASAGNMSDVVNLNPRFTKKLAGVDALLNMDEAADFKDRYPEGLWTSGAVDGTVYAVPWYFTSGGILYNTEILEEVGIENPPTTVDEAWEMSEKIYDKTGAIAGGYTTTAWQDLWILFPTMGIDLIAEDGSSAAFNTPEAVELLKERKEYFDKGLIPEDLLLDGSLAKEWYVEGKLAWWVSGPQLYRQVNDLSPEMYEKSAAAPGIVGSEGTLYSAIQNLVVSNQSENKELAVEFVEFITNVDNQLEFSKLVPILPGNKEAADNELFQSGEDSDDPEEKGLYYSAIDIEKAIDMSPPIAEANQINEILNETYVEVLINDKDPQEALNDAEKQVNDLLKE